MPSKLIKQILHFAHWQGLKDLIIESGPEGMIISGTELGLNQHNWHLPAKRQKELLADLKKIIDISGSQLGLNRYHKIRHKDKEWNFYITALQEGENNRIVINFINKKSRLRTLNQLGLEKDDLNFLKKTLQRRSGLIVLSAPFNNGLSQSLYALLNYLYKEDRSIYSLENFIEQKIKGVNQITIKKPDKAHYQRALEQLLKHDSEIIALSEIHDEKILPLALQAAASGRLVIASLRTDSIAQTISLLKKNCSVRLLKNELKLIISQKLINKNCPKCLHKRLLSKAEKSQLAKKYKNISPHLPKFVYESRNCQQCKNNKTDDDRIAIFALMANDYKKTLAADALLKMKNGLISTEEMLKI